MFGSLNARKVFLLLFVASAGFLIFDAFMQTKVTLKPCPMDFVERILMLLIASVSLIAFFMKYQGAQSKKIGGIICLLLSCLGIYVSGHHFWIQQLLPSQLSSYLSIPLEQLQHMGFQRILLAGFYGEQSCTVVTWAEQGLSSAGWFIGAFSVMALISLYQWLKKKG